MKLINTKDIRKIIDEEMSEVLIDLFNSESGPCRHVQVRPKKDRVTLLLDNKELMSQSLLKIGYPNGFEMDVFNEILAMWREDKMLELRNFLMID